MQNALTRRASSTSLAKSALASSSSACASSLIATRSPVADSPR
ncbi:hypothetical protein ACFSTC_41190 [Nonomuraea ferruginea]